uniref:Protein unc-112 n=1 Tax=Schistocephalus solidus TaxID=70667 RepID=A0A0V0J9X4_SCHSO
MTVRVSQQDFAMISEGGHYVDGSWVLSVRIDALKLDRKFRVQGDWSIGRVLVNLTEDLSYPPKPTLATSAISLCPDVGYSGWSEYALWWPAKRRWLLQTHASLDQYGIQADARLHFICTHGSLKVQLPDLQLREFCDVNFTEPVFKVVIRLCKHLGIRHPEELSLAHMGTRNMPGWLKQSTLSRTREERWSTLPSRTLSRSAFKLNTTSRPEIRPARPLSTTLQSLEEANGPTTAGPKLRSVGNKLQDSRRSLVFGPPRVRNRNGLHFASSASARQQLTSLGRGSRTDFSPSLYGGVAGAYKLEYIDDPTLVTSPPVSAKVALGSIHQLVRFRNFYQRARYASVWLELGRSLMEQGLSPAPLLLDEDERGDVTTARNPNRERPEEEDVQEEEEDEEKRVAEVPTVRLRFKYGLFYDLTAKNNAVRINQLFEQARWSIVTEAVECTNEEAAMFAALILQLHMASQHSEVDSGGDGHGSPFGSDLENGPRSATLPPQLRTGSPPYLSDASLGLHRSFGNLQRNRIASIQDLDCEIESLLDELTNTCIQDYNLSPTLRSVDGRSGVVCRRDNKYHCTVPGSSVGGRRALTLTDSRPDRQLSQQYDKKVTVADQTAAELALPNLSGYLKICKPRYLGIRVFKRVYVVLKKTILQVYKSLEDFQSNRAPIDQMNLLGCESHPDISPNDDRYTLKIFVPMSRVALPLSTALTANDPEELDFAGRLKRRASLLSLTSLGGIGAVCGRVVSRVSGLLSEVILRLPDEGAYIDWSSAVRLAGSLSAVAPKTSLTPETVRRLYEAEKKATSDLLQLLSPGPGSNTLMSVGSDTMDATMKEASSWLQSHLAEILPLRISGEDAKSAPLQDSPGASALLNHPQGKDDSHARLTKQILNVRSRLSEVRPIELKLQYISRWQQLAGNGIIYFLARFETTVPLAVALGIPPRTDSGGAVRSYSYPVSTTTFGQIHHQQLSTDPDFRQVTVSASRRTEVVGIGCGRVARYDQTTGEIHAAWRLDSIQGWHVNRELNELVLLLAPSPEDVATAATAAAGPASEPRGGRVIIRPLEVTVQKVAEALGANVFLSLRSPTKSQELDEGRFYKLIGAPRSNALALPVV